MLIDGESPGRSVDCVGSDGRDERNWPPASGFAGASGPHYCLGRYGCLPRRHTPQSKNQASVVFSLRQTLDGVAPSKLGVVGARGFGLLHQASPAPPTRPAHCRVRCLFLPSVGVRRLQILRQHSICEGMVGARGFEPPTPASRTRCATGLRYAPITIPADFFSAHVQG